MRLYLPHIAFFFLVLTALSGRSQTVTVSPENIDYISDFEENAFNHLVADEELSQLEMLLAIDPEMNDKRFRERQAQLIDIYEGLSKSIRPNASEKKKVERLFSKTRAKQFNEYSFIAAFPRLLEEGTFNCVSSSAMMALVFQEFGIEYQLRELPGHVFLYARAGDELVRVESTSPEGGVLRPSQQELKTYAFGEAQSDSWQKQEKDIDMRQLVGLQYYNQGLQMMDDKEIVPAWNAFSKAYLLYPCQRVAEMLHHTARIEIETALELFHNGKASESLDHFERAFQVDAQLPDLERFISVSVRAVLEKSGFAAEASEKLRQFYQRFSFIQKQQIIRSTESEILLWMASEQLQKGDLKSCRSYLNEMDNHCQAFKLIPEMDQLEKVVDVAWRNLIKADQIPEAKEVVEIGIRYFPASESLQHLARITADLQP